LVDTGSGTTCISKRIVDKIKLPIKPQNPGELCNLFTANGTKLNALGTVDVDFNLNGLVFPYVAIVIDNLSDQCILGTNFLTATSAKIDFENGIISFEDDLVRMPVSSPTNSDYVRVVNHTILPANSESIISVKIPPSFSNVESIIEPRTPFGSVNFAVAKCLVKPQGSKTVCQILNCTDEPIILVRNRRIGQ